MIQLNIHYSHKNKYRNSQIQRANDCNPYWYANNNKNQKKKQIRLENAFQTMICICRFVSEKRRARNTHKLLPGEEPVCHELAGSDCNSLVRHAVKWSVPPKNFSQMRLQGHSSSTTRNTEETQNETLTLL